MLKFSLLFIVLSKIFRIVVNVSLITVELMVGWDYSESINKLVGDIIIVDELFIVR